MARSRRLSTWRPALRIARREVARARGRNALVVAMVGLPVALVTCLASVYATDQISPAESIPVRLGATAAELQVIGNQAAWQDPTMNQYGTMPGTEDAEGASAGSDSPDSAASAADDVRRLEQLTGGRVIDLAEFPTMVRTERGRLAATVLSADVTTQQLRGIVQVRSGRLPHSDGEVLVSRELARRGHPIGTLIGLNDGADPARVVGIGEVPYPGMPSMVVALPGLRLPSDEVHHRYLLDRATPLTWHQVQRLNEAGVVAFSRQVVEHPPAQWTAPDGAGYWNHSGPDPATVAVLALIVFSIALEVVLLAGPAFAVGVRRQSRQLALVAAAGGTPRDVRRIVLVHGLVVGAGASIAGAALGVGSARAIVWALPRYRGTTLGPWDLDLRSTVAAAALGTLAALVAAWVPARTASRADIVSVLAGRRGQLRSPRGWPVLGAVLVAAGLAVVFGRGIRPGGEFGVVGGTLLIVLGVIATMPALVGLVGRLGAHLPLPLRLAARDSARQRGRTAPAVAAVMAAVAGVTALAIGATSDTQQRRLEYVPRQPAGVTTLSSSDIDATTWTAVERLVQSQTGRPIAPTSTLAQPLKHQLGYQTLEVYVAPRGCPAEPPAWNDENADPRCTSWQTAGQDVGSWGARGAIVAEPQVVERFGHALDAHQHEVLDHGGVLVPNPSLITDGRATVVVYRTDDQGAPTVLTSVTLPAAYLAPQSNMGMREYIDLVMTPATARDHDLPLVQDGAVLMADAGDPPLTKEAESRLTETLAGVSPSIAVYTERGFVDDVSLALLGLAGVGGLAVLIGTLTATGLALADSRPDLATLAAVGARPRTRRVMAAAQALVIGLLGALTGVAVGLVPGIAVTWPLTSTRWTGTSDGSAAHGPIIDIPWLMLLGIGLAVPVIAALAAGIGVRSRLPLTRRLGQ